MTVCNSCQLPIYTKKSSRTFIQQGVLKFDCNHVIHAICQSDIVKVLCEGKFKTEIVCPSCGKISEIMREYLFPDLEENSAGFAKVYLRPFFKDRDNLNKFLDNSKYSSVFKSKSNKRNLDLIRELTENNYSTLFNEIKSAADGVT